MITRGVLSNVIRKAFFIYKYTTAVVYLFIFRVVYINHYQWGNDVLSTPFCKGYILLYSIVVAKDTRV